MEFLEKHGIKIQVATFITVLVFIIGTTMKITQDRAVAIAAIESNKATNIRLEQTVAQLEKQVCDNREESMEEDRKLQGQSHRAELAYAEMKVELVGVKSLLAKIDQKMDKN